MSCRRASNASSRVSGPRGPVSARLASTSTMGRRRRAAAIASPSRVCAFSRTRNLSSSAGKVARSTAAGRLGALVAGPPGLVDSSVMTVSSYWSGDNGRRAAPVLTFTPFVRSRSWLAAGTPVRPGTGAGADAGRDWDAGREGRIGDGLLPNGGQRQFARPQAQRGIGAVAVVGRAGADLHRGLVQRERQQPDRREFLAAGVAGGGPPARGRRARGGLGPPAAVRRGRGATGGGPRDRTAGGD